MGKLFCQACHMELSMKKSILTKHISSSRHSQGKMEREKAKRNQQLLVQSWQIYKAQQASTPTGTGLTGALPNDVFVRRANVVEAFLKAGIPLAKADQLRPLMEGGSQRQTFSTHLSSLIPFLINNEKHRLKSELESASHLTVVFDGSTGLREAFAVVVRYMSSTFTIAQRLVRAHTLQKSSTAKEWAREIIRQSHQIRFHQRRLLPQFAMVLMSILLLCQL